MEVLNPSYSKYASGRMCAICLEYCQRDTVSLQQCGHIFHRQCIDACVRNNFSACPLCRQPILIGKTCSATISEDVFYALLGPRYLQWWNITRCRPLTR